jgi:LppX_LprAFG lipoprotein
VIRSLVARRSLAAAAIAPLLLTGVVACGDDAGDPDSAALASLEQGDQVDPDEFIDAVADGIEASTTAHLEMKLSLGDQLTTSASGDVDYTTDPPASALSMEVPGAGEMELVFVDDVLYLQVGAVSGGKYWKVDLSDPDGVFGRMGLDKMLDQSDPLGALESMKGAIDEVTLAGTEEVGGRDLDHYELTIDPQAVLHSYGTDLPDAAAEAMPDSMTYDIWLDDQDRLAQMELDFPVMGQQVSMEMTVDDWGQDVSIEAPPADQVAEMPDLGSILPGNPNSAAG